MIFIPGDDIFDQVTGRSVEIATMAPITSTTSTTTDPAGGASNVVFSDAPLEAFTTWTFKNKPYLPTFSMTDDNHRRSYNPDKTLARSAYFCAVANNPGPVNPNTNAPYRELRDITFDILEEAKVVYGGVSKDPTLFLSGAGLSETSATSDRRAGARYGRGMSKKVLSLQELQESEYEIEVFLDRAEGYDFSNPAWRDALAAPPLAEPDKYQPPRSYLVAGVYTSREEFGEDIVTTALRIMSGDVSGVANETTAVVKKGADVKNFNSVLEGLLVGVSEGYTKAKRVGLQTAIGRRRLEDIFFTSWRPFAVRDHVVEQEEHTHSLSYPLVYSPQELRE